MLVTVDVLGLWGSASLGKTTLLRNMIIQDIQAGQGVGLIDPHGDLAEELLDYIPSWRTEDVVYFNPSDLDYPSGFNLLQNVPDEARHLAASGVVNAFKGVWSDSWGPRLEYILHATVAALLECENTSLLGVQRMLVDKRYRDWVVKQVTDSMIRMLWSSIVAAGREIANNLSSKVLVDFIVSWNRLALSRRGLSVKIMLTAVTNKLASHFMKLRDQIAPLHTISSSPTFRIPGILPEESSS